MLSKVSMIVFRNVEVVNVNDIFVSNDNSRLIKKVVVMSNGIIFVFLWQSFELMVIFSKQSFIVVVVIIGKVIMEKVILVGQISNMIFVSSKSDVSMKLIF